MSDIQKTYTSDSPLSNVDARLTKAGGVYQGEVDIVFDGGRKTVTKTVLLADLTQEERDAGLLFYNALHAAGLALVAGDDF
jgi:hypothetical protein